MWFGGLGGRELVVVGLREYECVCAVAREGECVVVFDVVEPVW